MRPRSPPSTEKSASTYLNNFYFTCLFYSLLSCDDHSNCPYGRIEGRKEVELILEWDAALLSYIGH